MEAAKNASTNPAGSIRSQNEDLRAECAQKLSKNRLNSKGALSKNCFNKRAQGRGLQGGDGKTRRKWRTHFGRFDRQNTAFCEIGKKWEGGLITTNQRGRQTK